MHGPFGSEDSNNRWFHKTDNYTLIADITADINIKKVKTVMHGPFASAERNNSLIQITILIHQSFLI
jgi:hypothetical protein